MSAYSKKRSKAIATAAVIVSVLLSLALALSVLTRGFTDWAKLEPNTDDETASIIISMEDLHENLP